MTPAEEQAARIAGALWESVRFSGGTRIRDYRHYPAAFDPTWLASLPPPLGRDRPAGQPVALLSSTRIDRHLGPEIPRGPRTRVLEDIARCDEDSWYALAARHLTFLSGSALPVTCSVFESWSGDETFGRHRDPWLGVVVQVAGVKNWLLGECLLDGSSVPAKAVTSRAGDILSCSCPRTCPTPSRPPPTRDTRCTY